MSKKPLRFGPACYHVIHLSLPVVAIEMNFLYDEGLHDEDGNETYELVPHGLAPFSFEKLTLVQAMKDKDVDIATDVQPRTVFYQSSQGEDLCIIAGWRNNRPGSFMARAGIRTFHDLRGKRVGISDFNDNHHLQLSYWFHQAGINPHTEIQWVTGFGPEMRLEPLLSGKFDAGLFSYADHIEKLRQSGFELVKDFSRTYPDGRPDRVIAARARVLEERRDEVKAFLRAILRSYWFVRDRQNFRYLQNLDRRLRRHSPNYHERSRPLRVRSPEWLERHQPFPMDGLATGLEQYANEMLALGEIRAEVDYGKVSRQELMQEAYAELVARPELQDEVQRAREVEKRVGF
jgi:ABC-type nitrate/sulfonate/bicarbonate transport system substrate-binding protein